jgi:chloramphenicol O-acetyltransferase type A
MPRFLDLDTWPRRSHFDFYRAFDQPFFNLCAEVDVTALAERCREEGGPSFFVASLYLSLLAVNDVEAFHYRLRGDRVLVHDVVHGGSTVLRPDETFAFAYFDFAPDFARFAAAAERTLEAVRQGPAGLDARTERDDLVHYSVLPWVSFTSFAHARLRRSEDSVPKIVFGKHREAGGRRRMPVSVEVHHALVDGLHVGRFFERFESHLASAEELR